MEFSVIIMLASFISGATFNIMDIGTDLLLIKKYIHQTIAYEEIRASEVRLREKCATLRNPDWVIDCHNQGFEERRDILEERAPLDEDTWVITVLTGSWIGIGGQFQFIVFLFLIRRGKPNGPFQSLPLPIQLLILITSLFLLSPLVLYLYGTYVLIRFGKNDIIEKISLVT